MKREFRNVCTSPLHPSHRVLWIFWYPLSHDNILSIIQDSVVIVDTDTGYSAQ